MFLPLNSVEYVITNFASWFVIKNGPDLTWDLNLIINIEPDDLIGFDGKSEAKTCNIIIPKKNKNTKFKFSKLDILYRY